MKPAKPVSMKSSGTDNPSRYVGGWEAYDRPQGINDRRDRKVLAKEDTTEWNGKYVVWQGGGYRVAVDTPHAATYVTVWTDDGKRVGSLSTRTIPRYPEWLSVRDAQVDAKHRNNRLGFRMYQVLLQHLDPKYHGLAGYLPDQANKRQVPAIYRRLGGKPDPKNADVILVPRPSLTEDNQNGVLPLNDQTMAQARLFLKKKWTERFQERNGAGKAPADMSGSCKFVSMFVQRVFGGEIRGNRQHQFNVIDGKVVDFNHDASDVREIADPHRHDPKFWGNSEHVKSMQSCEQRVAAWVEEFLSMMRTVESIFGETMQFVPPEPEEEITISDEDQKVIKQSAKAPKKVVLANVRALSARGKRPRLNPYKLDETIRTPICGTLTNEYEIVDEADHTIGYASVVEGVIEEFQYQDSSDQSFRGHVASTILHQIVSEADRHQANLSIQIEEMDAEIKLMFERFGFRLDRGTVMKRLSGAVRPPSVPSTPGMSNRGVMESAGRSETDVSAGEISEFIQSMQNLVSSYRRSQRAATDIYHDYMMTGKFVEWLEANVVPIWHAAGYPPMGSEGWGAMQRTVIDRFLIGS